MGLLTDNQKALKVFSYKIFNRTYDLEQEVREYAWKVNRNFLEKEYEKGVITKYHERYYLDGEQLYLYSTEIRVSDSTWISRMPETPNVIAFQNDYIDFGKKLLGSFKVLESE